MIIRSIVKIKVVKHSLSSIEHVRNSLEINLEKDRLSVIGKGFLNKDDFIRAFERLTIKLNPETIDSAFKYVRFKEEHTASHLCLDNLMSMVMVVSVIEISIL